MTILPPHGLHPTSGSGQNESHVAGPGWLTRTHEATDPSLEPYFAGWREQSRRLLGERRVEFDSLVDRVEASIRSGRLAEAAADAQVAAKYATFFHPGLFASPELEDQLFRIGRAAIPMSRRASWSQGDVLRVLHVATELQNVGGHTRNIWRWMGHDRDNVHSVALTRQYMPVPDPLVHAAAESGGQVLYANRGRGTLINWARRLQGMMADCDLVVLHNHMCDVIPFLSLAGIQAPPPVILINHADHLFWLGGRFANIVASTRRSGHALCAERRGIPEGRNRLLPLCLAPAPRRLSRDAARTELGLPTGSVVILTVARAPKFRSIGGESFPDPLLPLLRQDPRLHLVIVGPGGTVDWPAAKGELSRQIRVVNETPETDLYYEAADIYLDSFPFISITSLFEAGLRGLPLVTRDAFGADAAVMAADSVGLDDVLLRSQTAAGLRDTIATLVADPAWRREIGERTRTRIEELNCGEAYLLAIRDVYRAAFAASDDVRRDPVGTLEACLHDIDLFTPFVYGNPTYMETAGARNSIATSHVLKVAPTLWSIGRSARILWFRQDRHLGIPLWRQFVPEWVGRAVRAFTTRIAS